jgi:hypothetical protein
MSSDKYKLYVDDKLIQSGRKLADLTLLKDESIRKLCPWHTWEIRTEDITINVSQYDPGVKLIDKKIEYFDGISHNAFRVHNGFGLKKFSVDLKNNYYDQYNLEEENTEEFVGNKIRDLRKQAKDFDGVVDDVEISMYLIKAKFVYPVFRYAPLDFMDSWIKAIKQNNYYHISDIKDDSFIVYTESWCLGAPCNINTKIVRKDIQQINF